MPSVHVHLLPLTILYFWFLLKSWLFFSKYSRFRFLQILSNARSRLGKDVVIWIFYKFSLLPEQDYVFEEIIINLFQQSTVYLPSKKLRTLPQDGLGILIRRKGTPKIAGWQNSRPFKTLLRPWSHWIWAAIPRTVVYILCVVDTGPECRGFPGDWGPWGCITTLTISDIVGVGHLYRVYSPSILTTHQIVFEINVLVQVNQIYWYVEITTTPLFEIHHVQWNINDIENK